MVEFDDVACLQVGPILGDLDRIVGTIQTGAAFSQIKPHYKHTIIFFCGVPHNHGQYSPKADFCIHLLTDVEQFLPFSSKGKAYAHP